MIFNTLPFMSPATSSDSHFLKYTFIFWATCKIKTDKTFIIIIIISAFQATLQNLNLGDLLCIFRLLPEDRWFFNNTQSSRKQKSRLLK